MIISLWFLVLCLTYLGGFISGQNTNVRFMVIGDWGAPALSYPDDVAELMNDYAGANRVDFIISTGDNFYPWGVPTPDHSDFDEIWRFRYNGTNIKDLVWYMSVGNHDYGVGTGEEWNQVTFSSTEPRWVLPHLWHTWNSPIGNNSDVHFIAIDTEALRQGLNNFTVMMDWLEDQLASSTSRWKIVYGHRPIFSSGRYGPLVSSMYNALHDLLLQYDTDVYLTGHDHNLQHINGLVDPGMEFIISGAGSTLYDYSAVAEELLITEYQKSLRFFHQNAGFIVFNIDQNSLNLEYYGVNRTGVQYEYTRNKA